MPNIAESGPRIFLTYSYSEPDARELRKSFHEACIEAGTVPVLFEGFAGQDIALELRRIILSCDLVIVLVSRKPSAGISYELAYTSSVGLPIIFFEKMTELPERTTFNPIELFKFRNSQDFLHSLYGYLVHFKERYLKSQAIVRKEQESKIMSILSASLESNVLVLGKDSDSVGLQKMDTIAHTVLRRGYVPVRLKELSDITFLSPEDKMIRIAGMCRFIIAEDSRPSGHIDELRICATCQYITSTVRCKPSIRCNTDS
jgi:hypothetical protein